MTSYLQVLLTFVLLVGLSPSVSLPLIGARGLHRRAARALDRYDPWAVGGGLPDPLNENGSPPPPPPPSSSSSQESRSRDTPSPPPLPADLPPLGPAHVIVDDLNTLQRDQLISMLRRSSIETKSDIKSAIATFVSELPHRLQKKVQHEMETADSHLERDMRHVKALSREAQKLFVDIQKVIRDDSITYQAERYRVDQLIDEARATTIDEFTDAHIPLPGLHPSHENTGAHEAVLSALGPLHVVAHLLNDKERDTLARILERSRHASKGEVRSQIEEFTRTLRPELQTAVKYETQLLAQTKSMDRQRMRSLSLEAQLLYMEVQAVLQDQTVTYDTERTEIRHLLAAAKPSILDELRDHHIKLPGLQKAPPPPPGQSSKAPTASSTVAAPTLALVVACLTLMTL